MPEQPAPHQQEADYIRFFKHYKNKKRKGIIYESYRYNSTGRIQCRN